MGGIYAREEGQPEEVWKAIYYHYLPVGVEADAPPTKAQLGKAAVTWAAVSLADKLDTIVGLFSAGEKPTGSRDPYGLRRAAQGVVKILVDLPELTGGRNVPLLKALQKAFQPFASSAATADAWRQLGITEFMWERRSHLFERRGYKTEEIRVVATVDDDFVKTFPSEALKRVAVLAKNKSSPDFRTMAFLFKRLKNITKGMEDDPSRDLAEVKKALKEPAEIELVDEMIDRWDGIRDAIQGGQLSEAIGLLSRFSAPVDRFFTDVLVMAEDQTLREARLAVLLRLRSAILKFFGDISQIVQDEEKATV
jgi:glycyl-tRNA synthetase beta chain